MATERCKKCSSLVAAGEKKCHICGAKMASTSKLVKGLSVFFVCIVLATCYSTMSSKPSTPLAPEQQAAADDARAKKAEEKRLADVAEAAKKAEQDKRERIQLRIAMGQDSVTKILKDPDSAKFGKVVFREPGVICGYVNAKNSFGGYTGEQAFISLGTPEMTWIDGQSKDFKKIWNERCASK